LRAARLATVDAVLRPTVSNRRAVGRWVARLGALLAPAVTFTPVGLGGEGGRVAVGRALLAAQPVGGGAPYVPAGSAVRSANAFWATPDAVSVTIGPPRGRRGRTAYAFATYEACSRRLTSLTLLTPAVTQLYDQFVYFDERDAVSVLDRSPASWCASIAAACPGDAAPYASPAACRAAYAVRIASGRVLCARTGGPFVPQNGVAGDTIACRARALALATAGVDVAASCGALGTPSSAARCAASGCPGGLTVDPFAAANPRFDGSNAFTCDLPRRTCTEMWK